MRHKEYIAIICGIFAKTGRDALPLIYSTSSHGCTVFKQLPDTHSVMSSCSDAQQMSQDYCILALLAPTAD